MVTDTVTSERPRASSISKGSPKRAGLPLILRVALLCSVVATIDTEACDRPCATKYSVSSGSNVGFNVPAITCKLESQGRLAAVPPVDVALNPELAAPLVAVAEPKLVALPLTPSVPPTDSPRPSDPDRAPHAISTTPSRTP